MTAASQAEGAMRRLLDGTFTRLDSEARVVTDKVPVDYIPSFEPPAVASNKGIRKPGYRHWTEAEDQMLLTRHKTGLSAIAVARKLGRSENSVRHRVKYLRDNPQHGATT